MNAMRRAIVLDFDGVLTRSMELHAEAYRRVLAPLGVEVTDRAVFLLEGARSESVIRGLCEPEGLHLPPEATGALANDKQKIFVQLGPAPLYDGTPALLDTLSATGAPLGLVTGTRRENLERILGPRLAAFQAVLSQEAYTHDKPHPEPYERTAQALDVPPTLCAALENAPRGVQSARAAGYAFVVGLTTTVAPADLRPHGPDRIVPDHAAAARELLAWLRAA